MLDYVGRVATLQSERALRLDSNHANQTLRHYYEQQDFIYCGLVMTDTGYQGATYERPID